MDIDDASGSKLATELKDEFGEEKAVYMHCDVTQKKELEGTGHPSYRGARISDRIWIMLEKITGNYNDFIDNSTNMNKYLITVPTRIYERL